jgi:hypothetical protein
MDAQAMTFADASSTTYCAEKRMETVTDSLRLFFTERQEHQ